jgi:hypothetical protein
MNVYFSFQLRRELESHGVYEATIFEDAEIDHDPRQDSFLVRNFLSGIEPMTALIQPLSNGLPCRISYICTIVKALNNDVKSRKFTSVKAISFNLIITIKVLFLSP